jgi:hypothetical protein
MDRVEGKWLPPAETAGGERILGTVKGSILGAGVEPRDQLIPVGETPVESRARDAGGGCDVGEARHWGLLEELLGCVEDALVVAQCVGAAHIGSFAFLTAHRHRYVEQLPPLSVPVGPFPQTSWIDFEKYGQKGTTANSKAISEGAP